MSEKNGRDSVLDWRLLLAAVFLAGAPILGGILYESRYDQSAANNAREYAKYADQQPIEPCPGIDAASLDKCASDARVKSELQKRQYDYNQDDLVAQRKTALWTEIMAWGALVGIALSVVGVILVWRTFKTASEANEISREDRRPIIAFNGIQWAVFHAPDQHQACFSWKNAGQRPARVIRLEIGREDVPKGHKPDFAKVLARFPVLQHDPVGFIVMPEGEHLSAPIMVSGRHFFEPVAGDRHDVYLLARVIYANALVGEHDRELSTALAIKILPQIDIARPKGLPESIVGYEIELVDDPNSTQMR